MNTNRTNIIIAEIAILAALALALDYLAQVTTGFLYPDGGSISIAMVPVMVISYRRGIIAGVTTGLIVGIIQVIWGGHILQIFQYLLDYPIAYAVVGLAGVFTYLNKGKLNYVNLTVGALVATLLRFLSHFIAGIVFWGSYAPEDMNVALYSFVYNAAYMIPTIIVSIILLVVLYRYAKQLFVVTENNDKKIIL